MLVEFDQVEPANRYSAERTLQEVTFSCVAPSATQVSAIVPYQVGASTSVRVEYQLRSSAAVAVPVAASAPGIFAYGGTSRAVVVNQDYTFNSDANPAARGDVVTLFATGEGQTSPAGVTGKMPPSGRWPGAGRSSRPWA